MTKKLIVSLTCFFSRLQFQTHLLQFLPLSPIIRGLVVSNNPLNKIILNSDCDQESVVSQVTPIVIIYSLLCYSHLFSTLVLHLHGFIRFATTTTSLHRTSCSASVPRHHRHQSSIITTTFQSPSVSSTFPIRLMNDDYYDDNDDVL